MILTVELVNDRYIVIETEDEAKWREVCYTSAPKWCNKYEPLRVITRRTQGSLESVLKEEMKKYGEWKVRGGSFTNMLPKVRFSTTTVGEGAFGKVKVTTQHGSHVEKIIKGDDEDLCYRTLVNEWIHGNIFQERGNLPYYHNVKKNDSGAYTIRMNYHGIQLDHFASKTSSKERVSLVRGILYQLVQAVRVIQQYCCAHTDLKPSNTLICPHTHKITLIDMGIMSCLDRYMYYRISGGTIAYWPEEAIGRVKMNATQADKMMVWLIGVIVVCFLSQRDLFYPITDSKLMCTDVMEATRTRDAILRIYKKIEYSSGIEFLENELLYQTDRPIYNLLASMLSRDEKSRPSLQDIYHNDGLWGKIRKKYPLTSVRRTRAKPHAFPVSDQRRSEYVVWIDRQLRALTKRSRILPMIIQMSDEYVATLRKEPDRYTYGLIFQVCMYICMQCSHTTCQVTKRKLVSMGEHYWPDKKKTKIEADFSSTLLRILNKVKGRVSPVTFDAHLRLLVPELEIIQPEIVLETLVATHPPYDMSVLQQKYLQLSKLDYVSKTESR